MKESTKPRIGRMLGDSPSRKMDKVELSAGTGQTVPALMLGAVLQRSYETPKVDSVRPRGFRSSPVSAARQPGFFPVSFAAERNAHIGGERAGCRSRACASVFRCSGVFRVAA